MIFELPDATSELFTASGMVFSWAFIARNHLVKASFVAVNIVHIALHTNIAAFVGIFAHLFSSPRTALLVFLLTFFQFGLDSFKALVKGSLALVASGFLLARVSLVMALAQWSGSFGTHKIVFTLLHFLLAYSCNEIGRAHV